MQEIIDVLSTQGEKTGQVRTFSDIHKEGLPHRAVQVWIVNENNELLLQKRAPTMHAYPDYWEISASGHVASGQTSAEAAQRETEEELGLSLPLERFQFLFTVEKRGILDNGLFINNEFQDVFLVRAQVNAHAVVSDAHEVSEVAWIPFRDLESWASAHDNKMIHHHEEYARIAQYLGEPVRHF